MVEIKTWAVSGLLGLTLVFGWAQAPTDGETIVVRAYFFDLAMVRELSSWTAPLSLDRGAGFVLLEVDLAAYKRLLELGFRLERDQVRTLELRQPLIPLPDQGSGIPGFPCYLTVAEIFAQVQQWLVLYPQLAAWIDIGDSWEKDQDPKAGYDLMVLKLSSQNRSGPKPALLALSSIHPRELSPVGLNLRFAQFLLEQYQLDGDVTWLLDEHEIHLLFLANPDGRKQAETGASWRKNTDNDFCSNTSNRGVDLNRNFEFMWSCCGGSSASPCNTVYRGPDPSSEPETQAVIGYARDIFPDQRGPALQDPAPPDSSGVFLDLHSFGEWVLWPYGFDNTPAPNGVALQTLGRKFAFFNGYRPEKASVSFVTDGTTDDFAYGDLGVAAYTFELGTSFFQDCNQFETTILPDNLEALIYAAKVARAPYLLPLGPDALSLGLTATFFGESVQYELVANIEDGNYSNSNGFEPRQNIAEAQYAVGAPPWRGQVFRDNLSLWPDPNRVLELADLISDPANLPIPQIFSMLPTDGAFDSPGEQVRAVLPALLLGPQRQLIFVRGRDLDGFWGPPTAIFWEPDQP